MQFLSGFQKLKKFLSDSKSITHVSSKIVNLITQRTKDSTEVYFYYLNMEQNFVNHKESNNNKSKLYAQRAGERLYRSRNSRYSIKNLKIFSFFGPMPL